MFSVSLYGKLPVLPHTSLVVKKYLKIFFVSIKLLKQVEKFRHLFLESTAKMGKFPVYLKFSNIKMLIYFCPHFHLRHC